MAFDLKQGGAGQTKWPIGTVLLLGGAAVVVVVLVMRNQAANAPQTIVASGPPPAGVSTFATRPNSTSRAAAAAAAAAAAKARGSDKRGDTSDIVGAPNQTPPLGPDGKPLPPPDTSTVASTAAAMPAEPVNDTIYDSLSKDVAAPTLLTPIVYSPLPTGVRRESLAGQIQVVVGQTGNVDTVKSTMTPKSVGETAFMTWALSIAKTWHFDPAIRAGRAVKYQVSMPVTIFVRDGKE